MLRKKIFPHSVMFHHFHDAFHPKSQGSIDKKQFEKILDHLEKNFNLIGADEFSQKVINGNLKENDIVLSFDDALRCQFDVAFPVITKRKISCFFFIYSSPFKNEPDLLEVYRYFRNSCYDNINIFYEDFFKLVKKQNTEKYKIIFKKFNKLNYLGDYKFYTNEDKWFRFLRDRYLNTFQYDEVMHYLMKEKNFVKENYIEKLWMDEKNLKKINSMGHILGLHSYYHPTLMENKSYKDQEIEYIKNLDHLEKILGKNQIYSMAHPCGSYNEDTLKILNKLNIKIGFKSDMNKKLNSSNLEIPREDHKHILMMLENV